MLQRALKTIRDGILGLAYPQQCRVCGRSVEAWDDGVVCADCWDDPTVTEFLTGIVCDKCGAPLARQTVPAEGSARSTSARFCGLCSSTHFAAARACGVYSGAFEASILSLKIAAHICPRLGAIICRTVSLHERALRSDVVMPVPLHPLRQSQRGFNQADLIARLIARKFGLARDDRSLKRIKPTERHRAGMDARDRAQSVHGAFEAARPRLVAGTSILLVDDLYTTGSTISAASQALLEAGARRVNVLTIARVGAR